MFGVERTARREKIYVHGEQDPTGQGPNFSTLSYQRCRWKIEQCSTVLLMLCRQCKLP